MRGYAEPGKKSFISRHYCCGFYSVTRLLLPSPPQSLVEDVSQHEPELTELINGAQQLLDSDIESVSVRYHTLNSRAIVSWNCGLWWTM